MTQNKTTENSQTYSKVHNTTIYGVADCPYPEMDQNIELMVRATEGPRYIVAYHSRVDGEQYDTIRSMILFMDGKPFTLYVYYAGETLIEDEVPNGINKSYLLESYMQALKTLNVKKGD